MKNNKEIASKIADMKTDGGGGVGVYGRKVCQICGKLGNFDGWVGAMASHRGGSDTFVCFPCKKQQMDKLGESTAQWLNGYITGRGWRHCEACAREVELPKDTVDPLKAPLVCGDCTKPEPRARFIAWKIEQGADPRVLVLQFEAQKIAIERIVNKGNRA